MTLYKWLKDCGWSPSMQRLGKRQGSDNVMFYDKKEREEDIGPKLLKH